jgi:hypothetical protein
MPYKKIPCRFCGINFALTEPQPISYREQALREAKISLGLKGSFPDTNAIVSLIADQREQVLALIAENQNLRSLLQRQSNTILTLQAEAELKPSSYGEQVYRQDLPPVPYYLRGQVLSQAQRIAELEAERDSLKEANAINSDFWRQQVDDLKRRIVELETGLMAIAILAKKGS